MPEDEHRSDKRDALLLLGTLRLGSGEQRVKIRNLSSGGAMIEGIDLPVETSVSLELPNIGWVEGKISWQFEGRCGVRLSVPIDPAKVRLAIAAAKPQTLTKKAPIRPL